MPHLFRMNSTGSCAAARRLGLNPRALKPTMLGLIACARARLSSTLSGAPPAEGDSNTVSLQGAAIRDAHCKLEADIRDRNIPGANMTVGAFLEKAAAADEFRNVIRKAERIG